MLPHRDAEMGNRGSAPKAIRLDMLY
uniref:Uncharacterized protein n=1 Tax=Anguilla anguilla TaxID=7936 RepID=A0A0E9SBT3_ANGAN